MTDWKELKEKYVEAVRRSKVMEEKIMLLKQINQLLQNQNVLLHEKIRMLEAGVEAYQQKYEGGSDEQIQASGN